MSIRFDAESVRGGRVLVVGDIMLDRFVYGTVERISPEAPIPVLRRTTSKSMPGGAANVAINLAALGAKAVLLGLAADDEEGRMLRDLLAQTPVPVESWIRSEPLRPTTVKTRYVAGGQQLLRVDHEQKKPIGAEIEAVLLAELERRIPEADALVLSDYGKGIFTDRMIAESLALARKASKPAVVDPKRSDFSVYRGATIIKPNRGELERATGILCDTGERIEAAARQVIALTDADVLVTRSERGMSLFRKDAPVQHAIATGRDVFDVSGAGDTALAGFAAMIASGHGAVEAMHIANLAGGLAVAKAGTAVVTAHDLIAALNEEVFLEPLERILGFGEAALLCAAWRKQGLAVGFTNGCFDILHVGHVSLLAKAAAECARLVVGLNSDRSVRRLKGSGRPAQSEASRAQVLASLDAVDAVVIFDDDTPIELITAIRPDVLIKGADYTARTVVGADLVRSYGGRLHFVDLIPGQSTTATLRRVVSQAGDIPGTD